MATTESIYKQLEALSDSHQKLKDKFRAFYAHVAEYLPSGQSRIKGLVFSELKDQRFSVTFCDKTLDFVFSVAIAPQGTPKGIIACMNRNLLDPNTFRLVQAVTYSTSGKADMDKPDDLDDPVMVDDLVGAIFILLSCIHREFVGAN